MNTYNSYFFAAGLVFFGLIIDKGIGIVPKSSVVLLIFAFLTASAAIFFIPLKKTSNKNCPAAKKLWLYTLLLSQFTVILTVVGVLSAVVVGFKLFS